MNIGSSLFLHELGVIMLIGLLYVIVFYTPELYRAFIAVFRFLTDVLNFCLGLIVMLVYLLVVCPVVYYRAFVRTKRSR